MKTAFRFLCVLQFNWVVKKNLFLKTRRCRNVLCTNGKLTLIESCWGDLLGKLKTVWNLAVGKFPGRNLRNESQWHITFPAGMQWLSRGERTKRGRSERKIHCEWTTTSRFLSCYISSQRCQERAADSTTFIIFYLRFSIKHFSFYFPIIFQKKLFQILSASAPAFYISYSTFFIEYDCCEGDSQFIHLKRYFEMTKIFHILQNASQLGTTCSLMT
jgi:hypothetical protein